MNSDFNEIQQHDGFISAVFADPFGRWVVLALLIVFGVGFMYVLGRRAWIGLARKVDVVIDQVQNDHVIKPEKTSNLRDDLDGKFNALHGRLDTIGKAVLINSENVSTLIKDYSSLNGRLLDIEATQTSEAIQKLREELNNDDRSNNQRF